jgi:hypothetical protein
MAKVIKFTISGHGAETDAPSVEDVLDQIRDYLDILRGVEEAAAGSGGSAIVWRVVDASRRSPLSMSFEAFPKQYATNIDARYHMIVSDTALGLEALQRSALRPRHFTDEVMKKARRAFERVTNGIGMSGADFGADLPKIDLTPSVARAAARNVDLVLASPDRPYQEIGSIEGHLNGIERDGHGRRIIYIRERITGALVKCIVPSEAAQVIQKIESLEIRDVWRTRRVVIFGRIDFRGPGNFEQVVADGIRFLGAKIDLPQIDDIIDPDFTGGIRSEEYLEMMRNGTLS